MDNFDYKKVYLIQECQYNILLTILKKYKSVGFSNRVLVCD